MKKNITIVTLTVILIASSVYWYNAVRTSKSQSERLSELVDNTLEIAKRLRDSEKAALDSADYYKKLAINQSHKIDSLEGKTEEYKKELDDISNIISSITPSEAYDSLQNYIPEPTGELEYGFDSTQVKDLYSDELRLSKLEPMVLTMEETIDAQKIEIGYIKEEASQLRTAVDSCNARVDTISNLADTAIERVNQVENELKWWKRGSVGVVITVVIIALL